jgi:hypothetical protein
MNSISKPNDLPENLETPGTDGSFEQSQAAAIDNEDARFDSEFAWLAAAPVTIASIATGIGLS